jgi:hypothetical protein
LNIIKLFLSRYVAYLFIGLEILFLPIILNKQQFSEIEYLKATISLTPYILLGSYSGYVYVKYKENRDLYKTLFSFSMSILLSASIFIAIYYKNYLLIFPIISYGLSMIFEKRLQVNNQFIVSILYKPIFSITILLVIYFKLFSINVTQVDVVNSLVFTYTLALFIWLTIGYIAIKSKLFIKVDLNLKVNWKDLIVSISLLIRKGFLINIGTIILGCYMFLDRYFIKEYYVHSLPTYSLAINFSQIVFIGINSIAYTQLILIGEDLKQVTYEYITKIIINSLKIFIVLFVISVMCVIGYGYFMKKFDLLLPFFINIVFFVGLFYTISVVSPVLMYFDKLLPSTIFLLTIFLLNLFLSFVIAKNELSVYCLIFKSSFLLFISGLYNLFLIYTKVKYGNK